VKNRRFSVVQGKTIIENIGLKAVAANPDELPNGETFDIWHSQLRTCALSKAEELGIAFSHGVAAKLINVYLKGMIVCGGHHEHQNACNLHPPIDSVLLDALYENNFGGLRDVWGAARRKRWSNFDSPCYEEVITAIKLAIPNRPLWEIESHWRGYQ